MRTWILGLSVVGVAFVVLSVDPRPRRSAPVAPAREHRRSVPPVTPAPQEQPITTPGAPRCVIDLIAASKTGDDRLPPRLQRYRDVLGDEQFSAYHGFALLERHEQTVPVSASTSKGRVELRPADSMRADDDRLSLHMSLHVDGKQLLSADYRTRSGAPLAVSGGPSGDGRHFYFITCTA